MPTPPIPAGTALDRHHLDLVPERGRPFRKVLDDPLTPA
jgi:hypothetical protein